jgi:hypothetical protein
MCFSVGRSRGVESDGEVFSNAHFAFPVSFAINMANQMTANPPEKIATKDVNFLHCALANHRYP